MNVDVEIRQGILVYVLIENPGSMPATDVTFSFEPTLIWSRRQLAPPLIANGTKVLPPGRRYLFLYDSFLELVQPSSQRAMQFSVTVSYRHPTAESPVQDVFSFDLDDYRESAIIRSEVTESADKVVEVLKKIQDGLEKLIGKVESVANIAHPSGLALSVTTLRNLQHLLKGDATIEKLYVERLSIALFQEAFGVDFDLAYRLRNHFGHDAKIRLEEIEGMTPELAERVRRLLV